MSRKLRLNNAHVISVTELNEILTVAQLGNQYIDIYFLNKVEKIDIVFLAGLILCNRTNNVRFSIDYGEFRDRNRIFEIRQYFKQFSNLFGTNWENIVDNFRGISNLTEDDFIASESFAPIMLINGGTMDSLFSDSSDDTSESFKELRHKYIERIKGNSQIESNYLLSEQSILNKLCLHSNIAIFIFTILYLKVLPFKGVRESTIESRILRTQELWEFTLAYISGLKELAKNIVEHSSTGEGIITIRVYDEMESEEYGKIFETHVFDYGENGIITHLTKATEKQALNSSIYKEDLAVLRGEFTLKDFIKPTR